MKVLVSQTCPTLCDPMECSLLGSSVHGILQARILKWVGTPFSRGLPYPGIKLGSPALQADSLPSEPPGKPRSQSSLLLIHCKSLSLATLPNEGPTSILLLLNCLWEFRILSQLYSTTLFSLPSPNLLCISETHLVIQAKKKDMIHLEAQRLSCHFIFSLLGFFLLRTLVV